MALCIIEQLAVSLTETCLCLLQQVRLLLSTVSVVTRTVSVTDVLSARLLSEQLLIRFRMLY